MKRTLLLALAAVLAFPLASCASGTGEALDDELTAVPAGKADDYYSTVAAEFEVSGSVRVTLDPERAADEAYRTEKIGKRLTGVALFLTAYVTNKLERFFTNMEYGGFSAMARNHTVAPGDMTETSPGVLDVRFTIDLAGPKDILSKLPRVEGGDPAIFAFELAMPAGYESDPSWIDRTQIRNFDPAKYTGEIEKVLCTIAPEETPANAWPEYAAMMADGVFDVTLFFGHDYNDPRSDLAEARDAFEQLTGWRGFAAPVDSYDRLVAASGPLTKTLRANGKDVRVEIRIFHSDMFKEDRRLGHDTALAEVAARDVFFYNGHAGPFYGFYLSDDKPNDVKYTELATYAMPEKQQIVVAQGCQTYSQYADAFYANPAKSEDNLDVITTVNFSYGLGTMGIVANLLATDGDGNHRPETFHAIVSDLNEDYWNSMKEVFYGVHGIDGNPKVHPYAATDRIGTPCKAAADCGDRTGNVCVKAPGGDGKVCGAVALDKAACPEGSAIHALASGSSVVRHACLPTAAVPNP
ncbi:MAG: hypothetical protein FJ087_05270 [Deltaproteobacteria bacterium]|nr:hypothetical protein [Deltaproteobacteria bacterium]